MVREETIFTAAVAAGSPEEQAAYLDQACADDTRLRRDVEALLAAHRQAAGILEFPPIHPGAKDPAGQAPEGVGSAVGPYKLLEQIGGGGMGVVYMAEQLRPVRRKVALKIIKPGMDSGQVIARFEAERQALTMMDHPNIASVLDAGTTDAGRPYFVMELVRGVPITHYCDRARLDTRQRLELFVLVCNAVQHAHQKGVIHRDLKPGNILVTLHDEKPVPKVIDFGIAKATGQQLTERTLFTNYSQMLGTPLYMSPEQAQISGLDVDTRSDVYSLGVLLYELLTGTTPFDKQRLREAAFDEMRRIIREEEPPMPSTRLSTMGARLTTISADRHTEPKKLGQLVRGELDWIVMKALEKDRTRRYETSNGLGRDVERYLRDEAVAACPPSATYRVRKFARRNKSVVGAATSLLLLVLLVVLTLAVTNARIRREQDRTRGEKVRAEAALGLAERRADEIRDDLRRLKSANALLDRGGWYLAERQWDEANAALTRAIELRPDHVSLYTWRGDMYAGLGLWDLAAADIDRQMQLREPDTALRWFQHVALRRAAGDDEACRRACRRMRELFGGTVHPSFARDLVRAHGLCPGAFADGNREEGARLMNLAQEVSARFHDSYALFVLGTAHFRAGEYEQAVARLGEGLAADDGHIRLLGQPALAMAWYRLGHADVARRHLGEAAATLDRWIESRYSGGATLSDGGRGEPASAVRWWEAIEMELWYREARLLIDGAAPAGDPRLLVLRGRAFMGLRLPEKAAPEYAAALALSPLDPQVRVESQRARAFVHLNRFEWAAAATELAVATDLRPDDAHLWRERALAQFAAGEVDAYRSSCAAMLTRFGETTDPLTACNVVHACVAAPGTPDDVRWLPLADVAAPSWHYGTWTRGAALYRAGRYDEAVRCFESASEKFRRRAWDWCFLAMAHRRLGHDAEARHCLAEARQWVEQADRNLAADFPATRSTWAGWDERPVYRLLLIEAGELLNGGPGGGPAGGPAATRAAPG